MKKNQNYEINFATNTITVKKSFLEKASTLDSDEYNTMIQLRALNMPIGVKTTHRKKTAPKWNMERMEKYLERIEDSEMYKAQFERIKDNPHAMVWAWFKSTFPYCQKAPVLNEKNEYIVRPAKYEKNQKANITKFRKAS